MVMAARAAHGDAEESATHRVELLVDDVELHLPAVVAGDHLGAQGEEPGGDEALDPLVRILPGSAGQQVSRDLFVDQAVEGLVPVERIDDVVPVAVRVGVGHVLVDAVRVGVASHVEPVAAPAFPVAWRREEPVDEPLVRVGRLVGEEGPHLLRGGRKAGQVERGAPDERPPRRGRSRPEPRLLEPGEDEAIQG